MESITEERVEKALHYLIEMSDEYAHAKAEARSLFYLLKSREAEAFIDSTAKTIEGKKMEARASPKYIETIDKYKEAEYNAELLEARMNAARTVISLWQSWTKGNQRTM